MRRHMARTKSEKKKRKEEKKRKRAANADKRKARNSVILKVLLCLVIAVVLGILPVFLNDPIGYVPIVAYTVLLLLCFVYILLCRHFLSFEGLSRVNTVIRGEKADFAIKLHNRGILPIVNIEPCLEVKNDAGGNISRERFTVSLAPFETYDVAFDTTFQHIGNYSVGVPTVEVHDLLNLFVSKLDTRAVCHLEVQPRVYDVNELGFDHELLKEVPEARSNMALEGADYSGVREYAVGDPMKSIHWKLSARGTTYYTKIFETLGKPGIEAVLDFHSPAYDSEDLLYVFDAIVEGGLSVGAYARKAGMDFELVFRGRSGIDERVAGIGAGPSRARFMMTIPTTMDTDERNLAALELYRRDTNTTRGEPNMTMVTASFDESVVTALLMAKRRHLNPSLIAVVPPSLDEEEVKKRTKCLARLDTAKISYMVIRSGQEVGGDVE